ncbi:MAG: sensor histidine kinase [Planctomycetota bacterium]
MSAAKPQPVANVERAASEVLAHELNNLLVGSMQTVAAATRALHRADASTTSAQQEHDVLRRLQNTELLLRRMAEVVETLGQSDAASMAVGERLPASLKVQTLGEAIDEALRSVEIEAASANIELDAMVDPRLAALPADALYTVVSNGLRNALEAIASHTPEHGQAGRVELRLKRDGDEVVFTLVDNGPGVDSNLQTPGGGFRFGKTTKLNGKGIGLGLSRQVAMALGGKLWLRNGLPQGAVLTLRFPVVSLEQRDPRGVA